MFQASQLQQSPSTQIAEADARRVAIDYARAIATFAQARWSRERGSQVIASELHSCGRAFYALSAYSAITGNASEITQRTFGPQWIVPLCMSGPQPAVVVSFSSLATELLAAAEAGKHPDYSRTDFLSFGVPTSASSTLFAPEAAAQKAFEVTGKRVARVPQLVLSPHPTAPAVVRWRVELESPATLRGAESGQARSRSAVYVGFGDTFADAGVMDADPRGGKVLTSWTDLVTRAPLRGVMAPLAPANLEMVTREGR
jgi:hypothetical protein